MHTHYNAAVALLAALLATPVAAAGEDEVGLGGHRPDAGATKSTEELRALAAHPLHESLDAPPAFRIGTVVGGCGGGGGCGLSGYY